MQRLTFRVTSTVSAASSPVRRRLGTSSILRAAASSSPREAEGPSAQSGGSRSKDAAEAATGSGHSNEPTGAMPDGLAEGDKRGATGGGKPLSSSEHPPAQPKIHNARVAGQREGLTEEQQREVDQHNEEFEKKHGRAASAADDKVDKQFWSGVGGKR